MRQDIEDFRITRGVPYLLHFTRAQNLPGILANGLVPRVEIDAGNHCGSTNDDLRLDGRREFNCLSATFPNAPMFYRFKSDNPGVEWPIVAVHPGIMARFHTLFCWQNAATNEMSGASENDLASLAAFRNLFAERVGYPTRESQLLKHADPTHVQAEILVKGVIPPAAIYCVIFPSVPCQNQYAGIMGERQSIISDRRGFYGTREYYRQWGHGKNG